MNILSRVSCSGLVLCSIAYQCLRSGILAFIASPTFAEIIAGQSLRRRGIIDALGAPIIGMFRGGWVCLKLSSMHAWPLSQFIKTLLILQR